MVYHSYRQRRNKKFQLLDNTETYYNWNKKGSEAIDLSNNFTSGESEFRTNKKRSGKVF